MNCSWITLSLQKERMESLKQRRTIRKYQQKDISADLLNDLLGNLFSGLLQSGNMQVYSVIVTRDAERKKPNWRLHFNQPMVPDGASSNTFCMGAPKHTSSGVSNGMEAEPGLLAGFSGL